jgi:hypothetical protein
VTEEFFGFAAAVVEAVLIMASWALVPGVVGWWIFTRSVVVAPRSSARKLGFRRPSFLTFAPLAPVITVSASLVGATAVVIPFEARRFLDPVFVGLLSLGLWGVVGSVLAFFLWVFSEPGRR